MILIVPEKLQFCRIIENVPMKRRRFKILLVIAVLVPVFFILVLYRHPIIVKWITGSARVVGLPVRASVYADGDIDRRIRVFHSDTYWDGEKADYYILYILSPYPYATKHIISLNIRDQYVGIPDVTSKSDFDLVFGLLFQSETGTKFSDFRDEMKGYGFDPQLETSARTILFRIPSKQKSAPGLIRIELSE